MTDDQYIALWDEAAREYIPRYPGYTALGGIGLDRWMTVALSQLIKTRQDELARERYGRS